MFDKILKYGCLILLLILLALAIITMDCLTYGNPPGLFKNETWQWLRRLWT